MVLCMRIVKYVIKYIVKDLNIVQNIFLKYLTYFYKTYPSILPVGEPFVGSGVGLYWV